MRVKNSLLIILLGFCLFSCDDILEEDISDNRVIAIRPTMDEEILGETVKFQWQKINGADHYRIQVFNTERSNTLMLDSLVSSREFLYNLSPGSYSWQIRGENNAYQTVYNYPIDFTVVYSEDLDGQSVILSTPTNNFYTNSTSIVYSWQKLSAAESYELQLDKELNGIETVYIEPDIALNNVSPQQNIYTEDAKYIWKVKAINSFSETDFSERILFLDRETPPLPSLLSPEDEEVFNDSQISFSWDLNQDNGNVNSDRYSVIQVSSDEDFTVIMEEEEVQNEQIDFSFSTAGQYYWRVKVEDIAGNNSGYSESQYFVIN